DSSFVGNRTKPCRPFRPFVDPSQRHRGWRLQAVRALPLRFRLRSPHSLLPASGWRVIAADRGRRRPALHAHVGSSWVPRRFTAFEHFALGFDQRIEFLLEFLVATRFFFQLLRLSLRLGVKALLFA